MHDFFLTAQFKADLEGATPVQDLCASGTLAVESFTCHYENLYPGSKIYFKEFVVMNADRIGCRVKEEDPITCPPVGSISVESRLGPH